jgi:hypothetical protein
LPERGVHENRRHAAQGMVAPAPDPGGTALLADGATAGAAGGGGAVTSGAGAAATGGGVGATEGSAAAGRLLIATGAVAGAAGVVREREGCGSRVASGMGSRWTTAAVTPACPELGCRDDHCRISSTTAGLSGLVRMSTLPSGCTARGTGVDWRTRSEGTWTTLAAVTLLATPLLAARPVRARRIGSLQAPGRGARGSPLLCQRARSARARGGIAAVLRSLRPRLPPSSSALLKVWSRGLG